MPVCVCVCVYFLCFINIFFDVNRPYNWLRNDKDRTFFRLTEILIHVLMCIH